jgi:hypothetical protein
LNLFLEAGKNMQTCKKLPFSINLVIFCCFLFTYFYQLSFAQVKKVNVLGKISDAETGLPLPNVDVYLLGTTLGDVADEHGNYIIEKVPYGNYELVVSMMGYEIQKREIAIYQSTLRRFDFELNPKVLLGEEVKVMTTEAKEWKKNLKILEKVFFGVKDFSEKCKFLNPEYINIEYDVVLRDFRAFAEEPIRFENRALGYEVTFELKYFFMKLDDRSNKDINRARYQRNKRTCYVQFYKEMVPKNNGEMKKWQKNRLKAYKGSQRHFLKSLSNGRLNKEGFEINGSTKITHWKDRKNLYRLKPNQLINKGDTNSQRILSFLNFVMVMYKKEENEVNRPEFNYSRNLQNREIQGKNFNSMNRMNDKNQSPYQISWIDIYGGKELIINTNGFIVPVHGSANLAIVNGYWLWDCPAEWLPYDYQPEK